MSDTAQIEELRAKSRQMAAAMQSPWEPACIARAFSTQRPGQIALTMQQWIDLEAIRSPLLRGEIPEEFNQVAAAAAIFGLALDELTVAEAVDVARAMRDACDERFATVMAMTDAPSTTDEETAAASAITAPSDGFGTWLLIWSALVVECGIAPSEARRMKAAEAFATIAGDRFNRGWSPRQGQIAYALRAGAEQENVEDVERIEDPHG